MLGVVLWSDAAERKAVIWCEDHGELAFFNASDTVLNSDDFFDAGDLIQFEMKVKNSARRACNARLLVENCASSLRCAPDRELRRNRPETIRRATVPRRRSAQRP